MLIPKYPQLNFFNLNKSDIKLHFICCVPQFSFRIKLLLFLDAAQPGMLKTDQNHFSMCFGSWEIGQREMCVKLGIQDGAECGNNYFSGTKDGIDPKPGSKFEFVHCLKWPIRTMKGPCRALFVQGDSFLSPNKNESVQHGKASF